jgi:hypothetical protein
MLSDSRYRPARRGSRAQQSQQRHRWARSMQRRAQLSWHRPRDTVTGGGRLLAWRGAATLWRVHGDVMMREGACVLIHQWWTLGWCDGLETRGRPGPGRGTAGGLWCGGRATGASGAPGRPHVSSPSQMARARCPGAGAGPRRRCSRGASARGGVLSQHAHGFGHAGRERPPGGGGGPCRARGLRTPRRQARWVYKGLGTVGVRAGTDTPCRQRAARSGTTERDIKTWEGEAEGHGQGGARCMAGLV